LVTSVKIIVGKETNDQHGLPFINVPSDVEVSAVLPDTSNKETECRTFGFCCKQKPFTLNLFPRSTAFL